MRIILTILLLNVQNAVVFAGELTIPHIFISNTSAKSNEVNENFAETAKSVTDNHKKIEANSLQINSLETRANQNSDRIGKLESANEKNIKDISKNSIDISKNSIDLSQNILKTESNTLAITDMTNGISQSSGLMVKANGVTIGYLLRWNSTVHFVLSNKYYLHTVNVVDAIGRPEKAGDIIQAWFFYASSDCTGVSYVADIGDALGVGSAIQGVVFAREFDKKIFYLPRGSKPVTPIPNQFLSRLTGSQCEQFNLVPGPKDIFFETVPNNPEVTGIYNSNFELPITIGR